MRFAMGDVGAAGPKPRLGISSPDPIIGLCRNQAISRAISIICVKLT